MRVRVRAFVGQNYPLGEKGCGPKNRVRGKEKSFQPIAALATCTSMFEEVEQDLGILSREITFTFMMMGSLGRRVCYFRHGQGRVHFTLYILDEKIRKMFSWKGCKIGEGRNSFRK